MEKYEVYFYDGQIIFKECWVYQYYKKWRVENSNNGDVEHFETQEEAFKYIEKYYNEDGTKKDVK